ncbi:DRTGG domain-containing protein [Dethiosulfovibrio salsuginis]|uniref:DRTGG domain-containing protein n=1 Tax=Dethiosulfovibrio salsuginis TaxID=561720 RepID=A0A1X7KH13_9BACT|nr:DRTGG domain-containing protein [Dethiosulfovibrio salsuginis]SMG39901.1 DRTGG domain-containing protein [Dethiosulfovibrio salsuginis]
MRLDQLAGFIDAEVVHGQEMLESIEIDHVYGADLMSDVLAFAQPGSLLLTGLTNIQIVRTAQMMDLPAVVFVRGKYPQKEAVDLAISLDMPVMVCHKSMFEACGILFREGLLPCSIEKRQAP